MKLLVALALVGALTCQPTSNIGDAVNEAVTSLPGVNSIDDQAQIVDPSSTAAIGMGGGERIGDISDPIPMELRRANCPTTEQGWQELQRRDPIEYALCRERRSGVQP